MAKQRKKAPGRPSRARLERSAGGVVLRRIDGEIHILLIRDPYGNLGLPKGHLEEDEASPQAALREVNEETGLTDLELGPELSTIDWYFRLKGRLIHKYCTFYLMSCPTGEAQPEETEGITECLWVPMDQAVEKIAYDNARTILVEAVEVIRGDPGLPFEI